jgi:arylsulfatase A-like enzyme
MPHINFGWADKGRDENVAGYPRRPEEIRQHIADYYAMISHVDHCIGKILKALEDKGELDNTIIVFCGDNGLAVGQHGLMGKQNIYDHSVHIPLIMAGPGIPEGEKREQYVYLLDVYPTLCELCGVEIPDSVEGKSFAGMFTDSNHVTREDLYLVFQARIRGVQDERYKLIEYRSEELKLTQLFDLKLDPWETLNFTGFTGYEEITARLRKRMEEYREEWDEEQHLYGQQYWQQWRNYEAGEVHGVDKPKGVNMMNQVKDWGLEKR